MIVFFVHAGSSDADGVCKRSAKVAKDDKERAELGNDYIML